MLEALRQDYQAMRTAQMFYGDTPTFENIAERLRSVEKEINSIWEDQG